MADNLLTHDAVNIVNVHMKKIEKKKNLRHFRFSITLLPRPIGRYLITSFSIIDTKREK